MRVTITGASGLIGTKLRAALEARGDEVIPVSLRDRGPIELGDVVVHLAGENVAQRWTDESRKRIEASRVEGTRRVVEAINAAETKPTALISSSAVGYYGKHGDEQLDESTPPGDDFLARVCVAWEDGGPAGADARRARPHRRRARQERWRAGEDAAAVQARRRRPGRRRRAVHAVDPRRRRRRHLPRRDRRRAAGPARSTPPRPSPSRTKSSAAHSGVRCTARRSPRSPGSRSARCTATWRRSSPRASAPFRSALWSSATSFGTPISTTHSRRRHQRPTEGIIEVRWVFRRNWIDSARCSRTPRRVSAPCQQRRRRITGGLAAGLLVFAAMTPSQIERADQPILRLAVGGERTSRGAV